MKELQEKLLSLFKLNPDKKFGIIELMNLTNTSKSTLYDNLNVLINQNFIIRDRYGSNGKVGIPNSYWKLTINRYSDNQLREEYEKSIHQNVYLPEYLYLNRLCDEIEKRKLVI